MIDRNPAVGRFVFGEGAATDPAGPIGEFRGRITKIAGKRVSFEHAGKSGYVYKVAACCDTEDEFLHLIDEANALKVRVQHCITEAIDFWNLIVEHDKQ